MKRLLALALLLSASAIAQQVTWQTQPTCPMAWMRSYGCVGTDTLVWVNGEGFDGWVQLTLHYDVGDLTLARTQTVLATSDGHLTGCFEIPVGAEVITVTYDFVKAPIRSQRHR